MSFQSAQSANPSESGLNRRDGWIISSLLVLCLLMLNIVDAAAQTPHKVHATGWVPPTEEQLAQLRKSPYFHEVKYVPPKAEALAAYPKRSVATNNGLVLYASPGMVDLSTTGFLPPVGDQGMEGACATFCTMYYCKTFLECREHNWDPTLSSHQMSPAFIYNYLTRGYSAGGTDLAAPATVTNLLGCATLDEMPYTGGSSSAFPSEAVWREAISFRGESITSFYNQTDSAATLNNIKQYLANGTPVAIGIEIGDNFMYYNGSNGPGVNNGVIFSMGNDDGGHAFTIIGYDDNKSYFDGTTTQTGALKFGLFRNYSG